MCMGMIMRVGAGAMGASSGEGERMGTSMGCCERGVFGRRGMRPRACTFYPGDR